MSDKDIKGRITCPYCGTQNGMRITADRNGSPFGFCDANCEGQLRVGGKTKRVDGFMRLHPNIALAFNPSAPANVSSSTPEQKPEPKPETPPAKKNEFTLFN